MRRQKTDAFGNLTVPATEGAVGDLHRAFSSVGQRIVDQGLTFSVVAVSSQTGRPFFYMTDLTQWPEEMEAAMLNSLPQARKIGGAPLDMRFCEDREIMTGEEEATDREL